jgi:hypothetical protein
MVSPGWMVMSNKEGYMNIVADLRDDQMASVGKIDRHSKIRA